MSSDASENASNVAVESWDPLDTASPALHHLPFKISHTGHANVSKYLVCKEKTIPGHSEQTATISSSVSAYLGLKIDKLPVQTFKSLTLPSTLHSAIYDCKTNFFQRQIYERNRSYPL